MALRAISSTSCVHRLGSFWRLYFERDPASSHFGCGVSIQNQSWRYTSSGKTQGQDKILSTRESALADSFFVFFCFLSEILWQVWFLFNFKLWKLQLCNCLSIQTLVVVHRSRNEDTLLLIKTNGYWREEYWFSWVEGLFEMPEHPFFASRWIF